MTPTSRRRIGVVTTSYPREPGDPAGAFVAGFASWLRDAGCAIEVIAAGPGRECIDQIPVFRIDGSDLFYHGGAPDRIAEGGRAAWAHAAAFQMKVAVEVARRTQRWDAAVSHWVAPSAIAVEIARAARIDRRRPWRHLAIAHSSDVALLRRTSFGRATLRWLSRRTDLVYSARHLIVDGAPGRVVPMGIAAPKSLDRARGRSRFALGARKTALFLGRLVAVKGLDLLLDGWRAEGPPEDLDLLVAGEGPRRRDWEERALSLGPRVRFLGEVRGDDKWDLLAAADLLVLPSRPLDDGRTEGTPTVLLEAIEAGLPVVATRTGGVAELLERVGSGLVVEPERRALAHAVARLAQNDALRCKLADRARDWRGRFDWQRVGPELAQNVI